MLSSPILFAELADVLVRPKFEVRLSHIQWTREMLLSDVQRLVEVINPPPLPQPVCRDPDDDHLLALALAARADLIISGDDDLLSLQSFSGIPIVGAAEAVRMLEDR